MDKTKRAFVTGWPIEHSRSPMIHNHWLNQFDLDGDYIRHPCSVDQIEEFLTGLPESEFVGGNVTLPHKETAFRICKHLDPAAKRMGAVNTIWIDNGELCGANTDGYGFLSNLDEKSTKWDCELNQKRGALVIGAGGASRAIIDGLIQRGFLNVTIANRTVEKAKSLVRTFGAKTRAISLDALVDPVTRDQQVKEVALIINTTSVGMGDDISPISLEGFRKDVVVNDIIYTPLETPLLAQARLLGMKPVDGLGMLLHQAVPGFEKWFGKRPLVTQELRDLVIANLDKAS